MSFLEAVAVTFRGSVFPLHFISFPSEFSFMILVLIITSSLGFAAGELFAIFALAALGSNNVVHSIALRFRKL